ncbi:MAG: SCO family protein [Dongiaceae bacterium]
MHRLLPQTRLARVAVAVSVALTLAVLALAGWQMQRRPTAPEGGAGTAMIGGPFRLTDQFGVVRTEADFRGRFMLLFFGFSYCPDVCPTVLQTMNTALDELGPAGERVAPIFITIDPARDTVERLHAYAANFHPRLVALTGSADEIAAVARAYRVYYARAGDDASGDYDMDHTSIVYLMGPDGAYVSHFTHETPIEEIIEAIRKRL